MKNSTQLFAKANEQKQAGKTDLVSFVLFRSLKALNDLIENTWAMEGAVEKVALSNVTRIEIIKESIQVECVESCNGVWLRMAEQVLRNNKLHPFVFAEALRTLIIKDRGKHINMIVTDTANCGKTFLFRPMEKLFKVFCNHAIDKYTRVEVVGAEVTFLNEFRWCKELISLMEMLLLLEGQPIQFHAPKNHYSKDVCLLSDTPVVGTAKSRVVFERNGKSDKDDGGPLESIRVYPPKPL